MKAIDRLKKEAQKYRFYEASQDIRYPIRTAVEDYKQTFPNDDWNQEYLLEVQPNKIYGTIPIVKWGAADTSIFRRKWGVSLPDWMQEFYSQITCALLPMLNAIRIFSPEEAVAAEDERREACDELHLPYRLIRFADGAEDGSGFSLRQRLDDDTWEIIVSGVSYSTQEYQSAEWDRYDDCKDRDIDAWLQRMLDTDGHPLMVGGGDVEPMPWKRLK